MYVTFDQMLKIPKQIYFDEPMLTVYEQYAQMTGQSFAAAIRESLQKQVPNVKTVIANKPQPFDIMSLFGSVKSPYKKIFTAKEERAAYLKAVYERNNR